MADISDENISEIELNYKKVYDKPISKAYLEQQFVNYDKIVKGYFTPEQMLRSFTGVSKDEDGNDQYKINYLTLDNEGKLHIYDPTSGDMIEMTVGKETDLKDLITG